MTWNMSKAEQKQCNEALARDNAEYEAEKRRAAANCARWEREGRAAKAGIPTEEELWQKEFKLSADRYREEKQREKDEQDERNQRWHDHIWGGEEEAEKAPVEYSDDSDEDPEEREQNRIRASFRQFDEDGSGYITKAELKAVLVSLGMANDECEVLFKHADKNGDLKLSYEEFVTYLFAEVDEQMNEGGTSEDEDDY